MAAGGGAAAGAAACDPLSVDGEQALIRTAARKDDKTRDELGTDSP
jgi:hypothetical protein